jgi:[ribosomal protein S5]-alanine N-acetyltransferase
MDPIHLTGRLVDLRDFHTSDIPDAVGIVGDDRVTRWLSFDARDPDQTAAMIEGVTAERRPSRAPSTT